MEILERHSDGVTVISVEGELDLATAPALRLIMDRVMSDGSDSVIVVDLNACEFMDSAGIRVLIDATHAVVWNTRRLNFIGLNGTAQTLYLEALAGL